MCPVAYCLTVAQKPCLCSPAHGPCPCSPASNWPMRPGGTDACIYCQLQHTCTITCSLHCGWYLLQTLHSFCTSIIPLWPYCCHLLDVDYWSWRQIHETLCWGAILPFLCSFPQPFPLIHPSSSTRAIAYQDKTVTCHDNYIHIYKFWPEVDHDKVEPLYRQILRAIWLSSLNPT